MNWQELVVALVVGWAAISLYRHLKGLLRIAKPGSKASCHGCDDCEDGASVAAPAVGLGRRESR